MGFNKWLNNEYLKENPDKMWIKDVSTKICDTNFNQCKYSFQKIFQGVVKIPTIQKEKQV
jgi:putative transposase